MKTKRFIFTIFFPVLFLCVPVLPQSQTDELKTFDKDGLSFRYSAGWELTDQSTAELQQLKLISAETPALIYVTSPRKPLATNDEIALAREGITDKFVENVEMTFGAERYAIQPREEDKYSEIKGKARPGTIVYGSFKKQPSTAEIYSAIIQHRFVNLVFIRNDKDKEKVFPAWQRILDTLNVITPNDEKMPALSTYNLTSGGVLNGKAISLPKPFYPNGVYLRGVRSVVVFVTIDETGKVIAAHASPGSVEKIFFPLAEQAAREARFKPSYLCGEPVQVTGTIIYHFDNRR